VDLDGKPCVRRERKIGELPVLEQIAGPAVVKSAFESPILAGLGIMLYVEVSAFAARENIVVEVNVEGTGGSVVEQVHDVTGSFDFEGIAAADGLLGGDVGIFGGAGGVAPRGPVGVVLRTQLLSGGVVVEVVGKDDGLRLKHHKGECQAEKK